MSAASLTQLVAIVGGSGAGKGWLVARLRERLGDRACHLQLDDFYCDRSHLPVSRRAVLNFDVPDAIDWDTVERVLLACRAGRMTQVPRYDFVTHTRAATPEAAWQPQPIVLVDGLWLLRLPWIRALFDLTIYLDIPTELRCRRRLERDVAERGRTAEAIRRQLRTTVVPMHDRYVEPQKQWADVVLTYPLLEPQITALVDRLDHGRVAELAAQTA